MLSYFFAKCYLIHFVLGLKFGVIRIVERNLFLAYTNHGLLVRRQKTKLPCVGNIVMSQQMESVFITLQLEKCQMTWKWTKWMEKLCYKKIAKVILMNEFNKQFSISWIAEPDWVYLKSKMDAKNGIYLWHWKVINLVDEIKFCKKVTGILKTFLCSSSSSNSSSK